MANLAGKKLQNMNTFGNKKGYLTISNELLASLLELPSGAVITSTITNYIKDSVTVFVKGYGPETPEGAPVKEIPHVIFRSNKIQEIET